MNFGHLLYEQIHCLANRHHWSFLGFLYLSFIEFTVLLYCQYAVRNPGAKAQTEPSLPVT